MQKYSEKLRHEALAMVRKGTSKTDVSRKLQIPYRTIMYWTLDIRLRKTYPKYLRQRMRHLARKGLAKTEVSRITGIPYATVTRYSKGIQVKNMGYERIVGTTLKLLRELVVNGYTFDDGNKTNRSSYKTLRKYFPVKQVKSGEIKIFFMEGSERKALEAFLEKLGKRSISYQELGMLRTAFGIKSMKRNNKKGDRS